MVFAFLSVPRKFSSECLAVVKQQTLLAKAPQKYFHEKLHRAETANV